MDALIGRWRADCATVAGHATAEAVDDVGGDLLRRWHEPHRHYHDATHLAEVLTAVDTLCTVGGVDRTHRSVAALNGLVRSVAFIVMGLLLLATGSRYAKAYERRRIIA